MSATSAQIFRFLWIMPSLGVRSERSPWGLVKCELWFKLYKQYFINSDFSSRNNHKQIINVHNSQFAVCSSSTWWMYCLTQVSSCAAMGPSIKDVGIFWPFLIPPPPYRNFDPDLPNFYLLISCIIGIWDPPAPLKYFVVFYGWPLTVRTLSTILSTLLRRVQNNCLHKKCAQNFQHTQYE